MKKIITLLLAFAVLFSFAGCGKNDETSDLTYPFEIIETNERINVDIEVENKGVIELELYPDVAPVTVSNFVYLAKKGFYDGLIFHRVIEGFMIQGGCPEGTGMGGPDHRIKGEFASNGFENNLKHERGVISMARTNNPDSAGSQFFIMHKNATHLDGDYAAFGRVINGIEIVDSIATTKTGENDKPIENVVIKTVTVK